MSCFLLMTVLEHWYMQPVFNRALCSKRWTNILKSTPIQCVIKFVSQLIATLHAPTHASHNYLHVGQLKIIRQQYHTNNYMVEVKIILITVLVYKLQILTTVLLITTISTIIISIAHTRLWNTAPCLFTSEVTKSRTLFLLTYDT